MPKSTRHTTRHSTTGRKHSNTWKHNAIQKVKPIINQIEVLSNQIEKYENDKAEFAPVERIRNVYRVNKFKPTSKEVDKRNKDVNELWHLDLLKPHVDVFFRGPITDKHPFYGLQCNDVKIALGLFNDNVGQAVKNTMNIIDQRKKKIKQKIIAFDNEYNRRLKLLKQRKQNLIRQTNKSIDYIKK